jgi:hypothetical protein
MEKIIDKERAYQILDRLTDDKPLDEAVAVLKDVIVHHWFFYGCESRHVLFEDQPDLAGHEDEIFELLRAGNKKIEAIKLVRSLTNMGLKDAKDWVEALDPAKFPKRNTVESPAIQVRLRQLFQILSDDYSVKLD